MSNATELYKYLDKLEANAVAGLMQLHEVVNMCQTAKKMLQSDILETPGVSSPGSLQGLLTAEDKAKLINGRAAVRRNQAIKHKNANA